MGRRNIYEGPNSCYARKEGFFVGGKKVSLSTAANIAALILRDRRRGWTYDHSCRKVPMTRLLFVKRLTYLIALAKKHVGREGVVKAVKNLVTYVLRHHKLPKMPILIYGKRKAEGIRIVKSVMGAERIKAKAKPLATALRHVKRVIEVL